MHTEFALSFERQTALSAADLYRGWTDPSLLMQWFTPKPWKTTDAKIEAIAGGAFETQMQSPEGVDMPRGNGCVLVAEVGRKFAWTNLMRAGFIPNELTDEEFPLVGILEFIPNADGAIYRAMALHSTAEHMALHEKMGFQLGWNAALDQLIELMK